MSEDSNTSQRFLLLLGASLVLHIFIATLVEQNLSDNFIGVVPQQPSINIQLTQTIAKTPSKSRLPKKEILKKLHPKVKQNQSVATLETKTHKTESKVTSSHSSSYQAVNRAEILSKIRTKIHTYFYYPRIAQTKNWQGTVILFFNFDRIGKINNIHVANSSGYSVLDNAAVTALTKVKQTLPLQTLSQSNQPPYELTIVYKLKEG